MARIPLQPDRGAQGEVVEVVRALLQYVRDKGQIPSATAFAELEVYAELLRDLGAEKLAEKLRRLPSRILELSPHEPRYAETVWQYALKTIAEGMVAKIEMVEQKRKHTKVVEA